MENKETTYNEVNKITETFTKEIESLSTEELHEFFRFFDHLNHQHYNMITPDKFEEFLEAFEDNPFRVNEDKKFRKQLIENIIKYAHDHMSLLTAAVLIKKKFTIAELTPNYYSSVDVFSGGWY